MKQTLIITTREIILKNIPFVFLLLGAMYLGLSGGATESGFFATFEALFRPTNVDPPLIQTIIWKIRLPRVIIAVLVGGSLSLGGLVFQALLRNPLAEPYILGISGGAAIGGIVGILLGLSRFPGINGLAFLGSMGTLVLVVFLSTGRAVLQKDALLLAGVMVNAFCNAVIMLLVSMAQDSRLHNIIFWLMGDLSATSLTEAGYLAILVVPCFLAIFFFSHVMNLLLLGKEMALSMGVNVKMVMLVLLLISSFMVSSTVAYCGLVGFVGLVIPHLLRMVLGSDHRILVPASILGGGAYLVLCDLLARSLPQNGEMPVGVVTAMIGVPIFIILLKRSKR